jgi:hypothetical protein
MTPMTSKQDKANINIESSQMVEISTQTILPTAKYHFLKCFDWENSLIYKEFTEKLPAHDTLMILG